MHSTPGTHGRHLGLIPHPLGDLLHPALHQPSQHGQHPYADSGYICTGWPTTPAVVRLPLDRKERGNHMEQIPTAAVLAVHL